MRLLRNVLLLVFAGFLGLWSAIPGNAAEGKLMLNAASGGVGGAWYVGLGSIGKLYMDANPNAEFNMLIGASVTNPRRIEVGDAELAITQAVNSVFAVKGEPPYKEALKEPRFMLNINDVTRLHILVRDDVPIRKLSDIAAQKYPLKLAAGTNGAVGYLVGQLLLKEYGVTFKDIRQWGGKIFNNHQNDVVSLMKDGLVEMFIWFGPGQNPNLQEIAGGTKVRWIPLDKEVIDKFDKLYGLTPAVIPGSWFGGAVGKDVDTFSNPTELLCAAKLSDDVVYGLVKSIMEGREEIALAVPAWGTIQPESVWRTHGFPMHPGAEKYYREQGWMK